MADMLDKTFLSDIKELLHQARQKIQSTINTAMVYTYYEIGRRIVQQEQKGKNRAEYGEEIIKQLSRSLTKEYGRGFSEMNIKLFRRFYLVYSQDEYDCILSSNNKEMIFINKNQKRQTVFVESDIVPYNYDGKHFYLSWSHYIVLIRIKNNLERRFYEIEAFNNGWSFRELSRQYNSGLYLRLINSKDKTKELELSTKGQLLNSPVDLIKDPYVLDFLGLEERPSCSEKELETSIIDKLQDFILELGKGFMFVKRQARMTFGEKHFYADLVFYNRILRCFVIIDLKIGELRHQDIGQMQMYVNYYDREVKLESENSTIGLLLCRTKDDAMVELTLPRDNNQIFASEYETILPKRDELIKLIKNKQ